MRAAAFHDLQEEHFRRYERANDKKARLTLLRNATAAENAQSEASDDANVEMRDSERVRRLIGDYGHTTDAASLLLAGANCPPEHRGFIDAVVGIAGDRTEWFSVTDEILATRAGRSTKWVQTHRKELLEWEDKHDITFIEIEDSYTDADLTRHAYKYRVHLAKYAADTKLDAEHSAEWHRNPGKALEEAAQTYRDSLPTMPPRKKRRRTYTPNAAQLIERELKRARTCLEKALKLQPMDGSRADMDTNLLATLQEQLAQLTGVSAHAESTVQTSSTKERRAVENRQREKLMQDSERVEVGEVETNGFSRLEKNSTRENIGFREDSEASEGVFDDAPLEPIDDFYQNCDRSQFSDEPPELTYEPDLDELAEREAIQAEACHLPLEPDELSVHTDESQTEIYEEGLTRQALLASGLKPNNAAGEPLEECTSSVADEQQLCALRE